MIDHRRDHARVQCICRMRHSDDHRIKICKCVKRRQRQPIFVKGFSRHRVRIVDENVQAKIR